jgi:hypothetical protein
MQVSKRMRFQVNRSVVFRKSVLTSWMLLQSHTLMRLSLLPRPDHNLEAATLRDGPACWTTVCRG